MKLIFRWPLLEPCSYVLWLPSLMLIEIDVIPFDLSYKKEYVELQNYVKKVTCKLFLCREFFSLFFYSIKSQSMF